MDNLLSGPIETASTVCASIEYIALANNYRTKTQTWQIPLRKLKMHLLARGQKSHDTYIDHYMPTWSETEN